MQQGYHKETDTFCSQLPLFRHLLSAISQDKKDTPCECPFCFGSEPCLLESSSVRFTQTDAPCGAIGMCKWNLLSPRTL